MPKAAEDSRVRDLVRRLGVRKAKFEHETRRFFLLKQNGVTEQIIGESFPPDHSR